MEFIFSPTNHTYKQVPDLELPFLQPLGLPCLRIVGLQQHLQEHSSCQENSDFTLRITKTQISVIHMF
jgi:hypothetical protein